MLLVAQEDTLRRSFIGIWGFVLLVVLSGCQSLGEELQARVSKALASASDDEQKILAVAKALWSTDTYRYDIKTTPKDDGYRLEIVSTPVVETTYLSSAGSLKDFKLRYDAKRIWRLFRTLEGRRLKEVAVTIKISLKSASGEKPLIDFLRFRCESGLIGRIEGYSSVNPFETQGTYDDLTPEGELFIQRLTNQLVIDVDNSKDVIIEPQKP